MNTTSGLKMGLYVDSANIYKCGGINMRYDVLREFVCRDGSEPIRLNAYLSYDQERSETDFDYKVKTEKYHSALRSFGYKVILKEVKWYQDEDGQRFGKANADLDLAVDLLNQSKNLDKVTLVSGDGDFGKLVTSVQNQGCRVEVIAMDNVSSELKREADLFLSGYLIPNLIPFSTRSVWGEVGSSVRGLCSYLDEDKGFGYFRFMTKISPHLWIFDNTSPDYPYGTAFFHASWLPGSVNISRLPNYNDIFEFELAKSKKKEGALEAQNIRLVNGE